MLRRVIRWLPIALVIGGASAAVAAVWLDNVGFCVPERRFLSDAEKIQAAADYAARRGFRLNFRVEREDGTGAEIMARTPVYPSAEELMAANPGCCRMWSPEKARTEWLRHPEWADERRHRRPERSVVVVDMAVPFTGPDGERRTATVRTNLGVRSCGNVEPRHLLKRVAQLTGKVRLG